jgi:hypothetical protein
MSKLDDVVKVVGSTPKEINLFFSSWQNHTELKRLDTIRSLRAIGQLSAKYKSNEMQEEFKCPLFGFSLSKPCTASSCQYHVKPTATNPLQVQMAHECRNCLINCLDTSKNNRLSAQEVAGILGISVSEVNNCNAAAVSKIRKAKIKESLEKFQIPRFEAFTGHCINCEQHIQDELDLNLWPELIIQSSMHGWCSFKCKEKKPRWQFLVEKEFGCNWLDALAVGVLLYSSIEGVGNIFGIHKDIIQKHKQEIQANFEFIHKTFGM